MKINNKVLDIIKDYRHLLDSKKFNDFFNVINNHVNATYSSYETIVQLVYEKYPECIYNMSFIPGCFFSWIETEELIIPENIKTIKHSAFSGGNINKLVFKGVKELESDSVKDVYNLQTVILPRTLEFIGNYSFYDCDRLFTLYYEGTVDEWKNIQKMSGWYIGSKILEVRCRNGIVNFRR